MAILFKLSQKYLKLKKLSVTCVPHELAEKQKLIRVLWCQEMLVKLNSGTCTRHYGIVTGDRTCFYRFYLQAEKQN